jgi:hypothetical protein
VVVGLLRILEDFHSQFSDRDESITHPFEEAGDGMLKWSETDRNPREQEDWFHRVLI